MFPALSLVRCGKSSCLLGRQRGQGTLISRIHNIIVNHSECQVVIHMADQLPLALRRHAGMKSLHLAVVDTYS